MLIGVPDLIPPVVAAGSLSRSVQPKIGAPNGLVLRAWQRGDAPTAMRAYQDPDIQHWHFRRFDTTDEADAWITETHTGWQAETSANWAIVAPGSPEPIGRAALTRVDLAGGHGEISYWVLPERRGQGVATDAVSALAGWGFADLGLHRLELRHSTDNPASCRVATNAGFALEGTMGGAQLHADGWHDKHLHARLNPTTEA
jgi:RimJ/RimL family protein N-acetyltransferase